MCATLRDRSRRDRTWPHATLGSLITSCRGAAMLAPPIIGLIAISGVFYAYLSGLRCIRRWEDQGRLER